MRHYHFDNIENFRDLGGYEARYGETAFGVIYRSATLCYASKEDIEKMHALGIKTILDIREEGTKATNPDPMKGDPRFEVIELNVNGHGRIPKDYQDGITSYLEMMEDPKTAREILLTILNCEKPMVIHCNAGKDRTGVFTMILLLLAGVRKDDINADYMLSFPCLRKMTHDTRANHPEVPEHCLTPNIEYLFDVFQRIESRYGTIENYCSVIGLNEEEIEGLANLLGKQEKSCGAVVCYQGKVLVEHMVKGHYSVPKGHVEKEDEDDYATARREIKEELNLEVDFIDGFKKAIVYSPKPGRIKRVVFFLAEAKSNKVTCQEKEVQAAYWLTPEDALRVLSHNSDRSLTYEALKVYFSKK